ncbi:recombinase family protein [Cellulophaga sp. E16_2]|uniref:recombinase family protein n=1 Tax=Cellulophaga sp. E16_2 TaxID=2789297 RepID=UPI001A931670|nr:recombinase family protein [Cellulophaga sp. E16_2]MBO0593131.1 recombinase family protein [Cellulophaga sp. E16_2]
MNNKVLAIYARKSGSSPTDTSIDSQVEGGKKYAKDNRYDIIEYIDEKVSGKKGLDTFEVDGNKYNKLYYYERPQFAQMIQDIKKGKIDAVWTYNQDRIERNTNIWIMFSSLIIEKQIIYIVNNNIVDLNDAMTKMISTIFSVFNEYYSMTTSLRVRPAHKKNALSGRTHGVIAYGYMRDPVTSKYAQDPDEAAVVKEIFNYYISNSLGAYLISEKLNIKGILCPYAKRQGEFKTKKNVYQEARKKEDTTWSGSTVLGILKNPIYKGYKYHGDVKIKIDDPIIDEVLWDKVNKALKSKSKGGKNAKHKYLLSDIIFCGHCTNIMIGKMRKNGTDNAYKCSTKQRDIKICTKSRGLSIPKLETFIIKHLFENVRLKELLLSLPQDDDKIQTIKNELKYHTNQLEDLKVKNDNFLSVINSPQKLDDASSIIKLLNKNTSNIETKKSDINTLNKQLELLNKEKQKQHIRDTIESYTTDYNFETLQRAVRTLIESIKITYVGNNIKEYYIFIKYVGTSTVTQFKTDHKALDFSCVGIQRKQQTTVVIDDETREYLSLTETGKELITKYDEEEIDTFISVGNEHFIIKLEKDSYILFN